MRIFVVKCVPKGEIELEEAAVKLLGKLWEDDEVRQEGTIFSNLSMELLDPVAEYARVQAAVGVSDAERSDWLAGFLGLNFHRLSVIAHTAHYLECTGLFDLILDHIVSLIHGKSPESIRQLLSIKNDFSEAEEKKFREDFYWAFQDSDSTLLPSSRGENVEGWGSLCDDIIIDLVNRIVGISSFVRFMGVCRDWKDAASRTHFKPLPWLMFPEDKDTTLRRFLDISTCEVHSLNLVTANLVRTVGSCHGRIIVVDCFATLRMVNILTECGLDLSDDLTCYLPSVNSSFLQLSDEGHRKLRDWLVLRASTSSSYKKDGCMLSVVVYLKDDDNTGMAYAWNCDKWFAVDQKNIRWIDFVGNELYAITSAGTIYKSNISPGCSIILECIGNIPEGDIGPSSFYTFGCQGKIYFLKRNLFVDPNKKMKEWDGGHDCYHTISFDLFELSNGELVRDFSIGNYSVFFGFNNTIVLPATSYSRRNCVYFTDDYHEGIFAKLTAKSGHDLGIFSFDDSCISSYCNDASSSPIKHSVPIWVLPDFRETDMVAELTLQW